MANILKTCPLSKVLEYGYDHGVEDQVMYSLKCVLPLVTRTHLLFLIEFIQK